MGGRGCPPIANSCSCQATPLQADEIEVEQLLSLWVKCLALRTFVIWVFCSGCSGREIYCITCSWTKCFLDIRIATFQGQHGTSTYILQTSSNNFGYFCQLCAAFRKNFLLRALKLHYQSSSGFSDRPGVQKTGICFFMVRRCPKLDVAFEFNIELYVSPCNIELLKML